MATAARLRVLGILLALPMMLYAATPDEDFRSLESKIRQAQGQDVPLLARVQFAQAVRLYEEAERMRSGKYTPETLSTRVEAASQALDAAIRAAGDARKVLSVPLSARSQDIQLEPALADRFAPADRMLGAAAAAYFSGNRGEAEKLAQAAAVEYSHIGASFLNETRAAEVRKALEAARGQVADSTYQNASAEYEKVRETLKGSAFVDISAAEKRLEAILDFLFPPFFRHPPMILSMGKFTLYVEKYDRLSWSVVDGAIVHADGFAWTSFQCASRIIPPYANLLTITRTFRVVETVRNTLEEISLEDARNIEASQSLNSQITLDVPTYATSGLQIAQAIKDI